MNNGGIDRIIGGGLLASEFADAGEGVLEARIEGLKRAGVTHVVINQALVSIPWVMDPENSYLRFTTLGTFGGIPTTFHGHYVASYRHAMEIYGTEGDLFITEYPTKLEQKMTDLTSGFEPVFDIREKIPPSEADLDALRDFAAAVRERRQPVMNGREGLKSLALVLEAARIAREVGPETGKR